MMQVNQSYDVVVAGGGPAGAATATLIADQGYSVLLLERDLEPRFKIGESLMPATYWTFERLGMLDKMHDSPFVQKHSVQFFPGSGKGTAPFYFSTVEEGPSAQTWQVVRSEFDQMLLDNASEKGVEVHRGARVREVVMEGERAVGARVVLPTGQEREISSRVFVDATGQRALLSDQLKMRDFNPCLQHASFFAHFENAVRGEGRDEGATLILHNEDQSAWFWYIPLPDDVMSVGVVGSLDYLIRSRSGDPQSVFEAELAKCPQVAERLTDARQLRPVEVARDFSYVARQMAGDGWILVGDAFGFLDPIYSSGVFLALKSGEFAADAVLDAFEHDDPSAERLRQFESEYLRGMDAIRQLVYAFYSDDFSFGEFLKRHPDCRRDIVHILIGNVFRVSVDGLKAPLQEMFDAASTPEAAGGAA